MHAPQCRQGVCPYIYIPVNPLPGVETNDDWVAWLTVVLI